VRRWPPGASDEFEQLQQLQQLVQFVELEFERFRPITR
jgi:hypothetical protein